MRRKLLFIIMLFLTIFYINTVYAKEAQLSCDSVKKNELVKKASTVTATYEFVYNSINEVVGFEHIIYNVPEGMTVNFYKEIDDNIVFNSSEYVAIDEETGIGKIYDDNINDTYSVVFRVYSTDSECAGVVKTLKYKKVKFNEYSKLNQCKFEGMEDYTYCKQWIDMDFPYTEQQIVDKINSRLEVDKTRTTLACINCEENEKNNEIYETIVKIRKYAIIGLSIGIAVDLIMIYVFIKRVGESRL